jgi:hypothetical protein
MGNISASEEHHANIESESVRPVIRDLRPAGFTVKAGGPQTIGAGGMVRSSGEGKVDYTLALDGVLFNRWAEHLDRATKPRGDFPGYAKRNWMQAINGTPEERTQVMDRARVSAFRHFLQWLRGERDEDHAAAVLFNLNVFETVKESL